MNKHQLSFAKINILNEQVAEVIVEQGTIISLEMSEEYDRFLTEVFSNNFALLVNKINQYDALIEQAASRYNLNKNLIIAQISKESSGNFKAISNCGAVGLLQLMPITARELGLNVKICTRKCDL